MPTRAAIIANSLELALVFVGVALLWPLVFSPAARARRATTAPSLAPWAAPLSDFLMFLWLLICGGVLAQFVVSFFLRGLSDDGKLVFGNAALELGMLAGIALHQLGLARDRASFVFAPLAAVRSGIVTFVLAVPIVIGTGLVWQFLLKGAGLPVEPQDMLGRLANAESRGLLAAMIALATITAPIAEELTFRFGLFRYVRTRLPRWAALLLPTCLWAAMHQSLTSFGPLVALGLVLSLAYERTGRIGTVIVAHALFNAHTVALVLIDPNAALN